jgi:hypothetical protein
LSGGGAGLHMIDLWPGQALSFGAHGLP